jgi:hypothetical protein
MAGRVLDLDGLRLTTAKAWKKALVVPGEAFGTRHLFGDPGWSLIIELYLNRMEDRCLTLTGAAEAMRVSETAASRWVNQFEKADWLVSLSDVGNNRLMYLRLTDEGLDRAEYALDAAAAGDRELGLARLDFTR